MHSVGLQRVPAKAKTGDGGFRAHKLRMGEGVRWGGVSVGTAQNHLSCYIVQLGCPTVVSGLRAYRLHRFGVHRLGCRRREGSGWYPGNNQKP